MTEIRKFIPWFVVLTFVAGLAVGTLVTGQAAAGARTAQLTVPDPVQLSNVFSRLAEQVGPAVVSIDVQSRAELTRLGRFRSPFDEFFGSDPRRGDGPGAVPEVRGTGSGFIVDPDGYILTNNHVVDRASRITVRLADDSEFDAAIIGTDAETDLAVIKIDSGYDLPVARLGNSDATAPGDWVLALGSPFGFAQTLTAGIISAKGRGPEEVGPGTTQFQQFIQTDAAINPGNSGGPLINMAGEVIGINSAILSSTYSFAGVGLALPSNTAIGVYNQLVADGRVTRGYIGIYMNSDPAAPEAFGASEGVVVDSVIDGGPAQMAGLRGGDVIVAVAGEPVADSDSLLRLVASQGVGETVPIRILRDGRELSLSLEVADREQFELQTRREETSPFRRR